MITAPQNPETASTAGEREELKRVLRSNLFTRAPTLAHLLAYLCEKSFAGESNQIKEYSVGIDVFHRSPDFDQEADSIVRVQANRLRKRLAEYYAGEGATHPLQISIPLGQYVPIFLSPNLANSVAEAPATPAASITTQLSLSRNSALWLSIAAALLAAMLAASLFLLHRARSAHPIASPSQTVQETSELVGLPMGDELRILAGASRGYVDHAGKLWASDAYFVGGNAVRSQVQHIWRTQDQSFYRTSRQGDFRYDLPLKKGIYELRLHFAENYYGPDNVGSGGEGSRTINVVANGKPLLTDFDVVADAGSATADVKVFTNISPAADGYLHLAFSSSQNGSAMLSAIEILPGIRGGIRPVRILARSSPYYSNDSHWWSPDNYFRGGQLATNSEPVRGTDDPELFESARWGNFSYAIPVTPGKYEVKLYFSALNRRNLTDATAVEQIFSVFCNGRSILDNFNLQERAGNNDVVIRHFSNLEADAQGKLLLEFIPIKGYATVTGIEVLPQ